MNKAGHAIGSAMAGPSVWEVAQQWKREQRYIQRTKAVHNLQKQIEATRKGIENAQEVVGFLQSIGKFEDARGLQSQIAQRREDITSFERQIQEIYCSKK